MSTPEDEGENIRGGLRLIVALIQYAEAKTGEDGDSIGFPDDFKDEEV